MRNTCFFSFYTFLMFFSFSLAGQEMAVTERGDTVVLFSNGTWDYYDNYLNNREGTPQMRINPEIFTRPKTSNKKINGKNHAYEIWYNDKEWRRVPAGDLNEEADVALQLIEGDAYAMVIYEELEIPFENLSQIALDNATTVAPDITLVDREYRVVNNDTLVWMRMDGTTKGMKISYYSYYYSSAKGSVQFHTFTGQALIEKYKDEIETLLNGLINPD